MHEAFAALIRGLHPKFEHLMSTPPCRGGVFPKPMPKQGVYLFSEGDAYLYVGRSNKIRSRWGRHCNPGATHRMAAFAFKLAREAMGKMTASYKNDDNSRANLMLDPAFRAAFDDAKRRIRAMDFRFVEECDPNAQALLEIYCTLALNARYNDFDTH
jgi:hypothetical protein